MKRIVENYVFKSPKGWRRTQKDGGQATYTHTADGRKIVIAEDHSGGLSYNVTWEIEKSNSWEDWKRKEFAEEKDAQKFMLELMRLSNKKDKNLLTDDENYNKYICGSCGEFCNEYTYNEESDVDECNDCKTINKKK